MLAPLLSLISLILAPPFPMMPPTMPWLTSTLISLGLPSSSSCSYMKGMAASTTWQHDSKSSHVTDMIRSGPGASGILEQESVRTRMCPEVMIRMCPEVRIKMSPKSGSG